MQLITDENKKEIFYNLINSALAGGLVLLGSLTGGQFTSTGVYTALVASLIVAVTKFKNYWESEKNEYSRCRNKTLMNFV